jgi:CheY-like chemotaxis protein/anti-sigma regulatory factor (Ser/Thr protein kinase)
VVTGVVRLLAEKARAKGIGLAANVDAEVPRSLRGDPVRLRQVLTNLVDNAVKFTAKGEVLIRVQVEHGTPVGGNDAMVRFEVRDSGIGIGEADMKTLFQPFRQVGDIERRRGGTGLGLAISRQLVRLMGSDIEVTSTPGQGSVFAFELRLPLAEAQASLPADRIALGYDGERKKVLVVDDVAENRALLIDMLRPLGFLTFEAHNGREGVERAQALLPDLILMDNVMPVMNGLEATRLLRATPALKDVPVLAISASASQADREMAVDAGATDFVSKPFRAAQLLALFERHLGIRFHTR